MVTKSCYQCSKEFLVTPARQDIAKYCSSNCSNMARRKYKKCVICETDFWPVDQRTRTCSQACALKVMNKQVAFNCLTCNTSFSVPPSRVGKAKFCSHTCYTEHKKTTKKTNSVCDLPGCNNAFYKAPSLKLKHDYSYCSRDCYSTHSSLIGKMSGKNNPNWTGLSDKHKRKKYYGPDWLTQRRASRKRDDYTCQECGIKEDAYGQELSVHHIKPFVLCEDYLEANKLENLLSVCEPCHRIIHSGQNHPRHYKERSS